MEATSSFSIPYHPPDPPEEPLQPIAFEQWEYYLETFQLEWPKFGYYYYWLLNSIKWKKARPSYQQIIYCQDVSIYSKTLVSIEKAGITTVVVFSLDDPDTLYQYLTKTKVIDWSETMYFYFIDPKYKRTMKKLLEEKQQSTYFKFNTRVYTSCYYFKPKEECVELQVGPVPEGYEIRKLDDSHLEQISSVWPHREENVEETIDYFRNPVELNLCLGLFDTDDDSLICWCLHGAVGGLQALQTIETHRGKGFARLVLGTLMKELATEENLDMTCFIVKENASSIKLFESFGFQNVGLAAFARWMKKG